jgi:hypothetical protein
MAPTGGGPNWFSKLAVASTSSNVTPLLLLLLESPSRKLLNMISFQRLRVL